MGADSPWRTGLKVLVLVGTRPEAIKMAPVIRELGGFAGEIEPVVCATGQQREMLDQVLEVFGIRPHHDLDLMQPGQTLSQITARVLRALDGILEAELPDWLLVQGDTTTAMAGALGAYHHKIRVGHVEAGLRTGDKFQPFPEEINRRIVDSLSDLHFAPTPGNRSNLLREGFPDEKIVLTGNTVIDALLETVDQLRNSVTGAPDPPPDGVRRLLVTAHRRENFGPPLVEICRAITEIAAAHPLDLEIVCPVHLNPNVREPFYQTLYGIPNVRLTDPLGYREFVALMSQAYLVLTDSGGLQEEAPGLGIPVLVLRDVTERPEAVEAGTVRLVGTSCRRIVDETLTLLRDRDAYNRMSRAVNPYGDGRASQRIVAALLGRPFVAFGGTGTSLYD